MEQNMAEMVLDRFLSGLRVTADIPVIHVHVTGTRIQFIQFRFRQRHKMETDHGMLNRVRLHWRLHIVREKVPREKFIQQTYIISAQMPILGHQHQLHFVQESLRLHSRQIIN